MGMRSQPPPATDKQGAHAPPSEAALRPRSRAPEDDFSEDGLFEHAFQHAPIGMALVAPSGRWLKVNEALCRLVGYRREELLATDFQSITHPSDLERDLTEVGRLLEGAIESYELEKRYIRRDGTTVWALLSVSLVRRQDGSARFFIAQIQDLSRTKRAEVELARVSATSPDVLAAQERMRNWLAAIVESAGDAIIGVAADGRIFSWNGGAERLYGYRAEEMVGQHVERLAANDAGRAEILAVWQRAVSGVKHQEHDAVRARSSGEPIDVHVQVRAVEDSQGAVIGWSVTTRDISERKRLAEQLADQVETYGAIARSLPQGSVTVFDRALRVVAAEGELLQLLGIANEAVIGRSVTEATSAQNREALERIYKRALEGESSEFEAKRAGRTLMIRVAPLRDARAQISGGLVLSLDVTEQRQKADQLQRAKLLLDATIENIPDGVVLLDMDRQVLFANDAFATMFGLERDQLVGLDRARFYALVSEQFEQPADFRGHLQTSALGKRSPSEFVIHRPKRRVLRVELKPVGGVTEAGYLAIWRDVTHESDLLAQRGREALTDVLTGITNRRGAEAALQAAVAQAQRAGTPLSVAMLDIDHFKRINDLHGHGVGDAVIQAVAKALSAEARASDLVARWGGEEFIAVLPIGREGARAFCERVRLAIGALSLPSRVRVTISAGFATNGNVTCAGTLVQQADQRLYEAKLGGRDRVAG